jgi:hypothetical protein
MILTRYGSTPLGTFGKLDANGIEFVTVEQPWNHNRPYVSCVPLGKYQLLWRPTTTSVPAVFENHTWYLYNNDVGFIEETGKTRFNCCVHIGNVSGDVSGCIGLGIWFGYPYSQWGVIHSRRAMEQLYSAIGPKDTELVIVGSCMG